MTQEEKAKAYDKALEKARQLCAYPTSNPFMSDLQDIFPELKESEDERIRKAIENVIRMYGKTQGEWIGGYDMDTLIIHLRKAFEKQDKQKLAWSKYDEEFLLELSQCCDLNKTQVQWLLSLKDRVQPQTQWKSSDKHYELEEFARIVRGNLTGISKAVQKLFEAKYLQLTGNKMYGGFKD